MNLSLKEIIEKELEGWDVRFQPSSGMVGLTVISSDDELEFFLFEEEFEMLSLELLRESLKRYGAELDSLILPVP